MKKLMGQARFTLEHLRGRSTRRQMGTLHIKVDQLNRRMTQLVTAAEQSALPMQEVDKGTQVSICLPIRETGQG